MGKTVRPAFWRIRKIFLLMILFLHFFVSFTSLSASESVKSIYDKVRRSYHSLVNKKPANRKKWIECAEKFKKIYLKFPQTQESVKSLFSEANLYYELSRVSQKKTDLSKAESLYKTFIKKYPASRFSDDALYKIGIINIRRGDKKEALENFTVLIKKYPKGDMRKRAQVKKNKLAEPKSGSSLKYRSQNLKTTRIKRKECIIVIDPGHGGKDGGATGINGIKEKKVVLGISVRLKKLIEKQGRCQVILTREEDKFIPLPDRTAMANLSKATLFVSIHANASDSANVSGIETYFQGLPRTQQERETAARENMVDIQREFSTKDNMLGFILSDMNNAYLINESSNFAGVVQNYLVKEVVSKFSGTRNLGVKQALFYVLHDAEMPSILVEVSFMTHSVEGKRLARKSYRNKLSMALYRGIQAYLRKKM